MSPLRIVHASGEPPNHLTNVAAAEATLLPLPTARVDPPQLPCRLAPAVVSGSAAACQSPRVLEMLPCMPTGPHAGLSREAAEPLSKSFHCVCEKSVAVVA